MRTLVFNVHRITLVEGPPSTKSTCYPVTSPSHQRDTLIDVAVAFICVEEHDAPVDIETIATELVRHSQRIGRQVFLVPFVHLSSYPERNSAIAHANIGAVADALNRAKLLVASSGFGIHHGMIAEWMSIGHRGPDVIFRDSRATSSSGREA